MMLPANQNVQKRRDQGSVCSDFSEMDQHLRLQHHLLVPFEEGFVNRSCRRRYLAGCDAGTTIYTPEAMSEPQILHLKAYAIFDSNYGLCTFTIKDGIIGAELFWFCNVKLWDGPKGKIYLAVSNSGAEHAQSKQPSNNHEIVAQIMG